MSSNEWREWPPDESEHKHVIACHERGFVVIMEWSSIGGAWGHWDPYTGDVCTVRSGLTHWAPIPAPPSPWKFKSVPQESQAQ